jgi:hypothetical protein
MTGAYSTTGGTPPYWSLDRGHDVLCIFAARRLK